MLPLMLWVVDLPDEGVYLPRGVLPMGIRVAGAEPVQGRMGLQGVEPEPAACGACGDAYDLGETGVELACVRGLGCPLQRCV